MRPEFLRLLSAGDDRQRKQRDRADLIPRPEQPRKFEQSACPMSTALLAARTMVLTMAAQLSL
jgi:hypothetical protein